MRYAILKDPEKIGLKTKLFTPFKDGYIVNENDILLSNAEGNSAEEKAKNIGVNLIGLETLREMRNG